MFIVSGGYGTVYRARRTKDGKTFAIKCMNTRPPIFMYSFLLFFMKAFVRKKLTMYVYVTGPHPNAHSHHLNNELKMLQRFGY